MPYPIIAIPACRDTSSGGIGISKLNLAYSRALQRNGGVPLLIPYTDEEETILPLLALAQGVLIPGGIDVAPALFGEEPLPGLGEVDPVRDTQETIILRYAEEHGLPVMGICRGEQMMNVFCGGTLYQDISSQLPQTVNHARHRERKCTVHTVTTGKRTCMRDLLGERLEVNSCHHQSVKDVADGFIASAIAEDGVIEAIEGKDGTWLGFQWHPEELVDSSPVMNKIFTHFVGLCGDDFPEYWE